MLSARPRNQHNTANSSYLEIILFEGYIFGNSWFTQTNPRHRNGGCNHQVNSTSQWLSWRININNIMQHTHFTAAIEQNCKTYLKRTQVITVSLIYHALQKYIWNKNLSLTRFCGVPLENISPNTQDIKHYKFCWNHIFKIIATPSDVI